MREVVKQGDILKVERIKYPVLVTSKDFFNQSGEIIGCPVFPEGVPGALHISVHSDTINGYVHCEKLTLLYLNVRGYSKLGSIQIADVMNITDAIQGIFDYV